MSFTITFDGQEIRCRPGWTIGAALTAAGIGSWRVTRREQKPRGLFCGIGVCFDCLATVNGRPSVRVCLTPATPGDEVRTQHGTGSDDLAC
jgi:predicted molibdopterin-dependent oxidoreductase YjgC